ncbi:MAG: sarcosine oxidase subunit gamma [Mangrovicoccus sp.]
MHPISAQSPGVLTASSAAKIDLLAPVARFSLRARGDLAPFSQALGLSLPAKIGMRAKQGEVEVLCLGPDEWVILAATDQAPGLAAAMAAIYPAYPHSFVDISGREITLAITGSCATELLTLGMPRDPESILPGEGRRIAFDGMTVVLWRDEAEAYRMDIWHSFAPHLLGLLETGCRELAAEPA